MITIENAYAQLLVERYIYSVEKKGYFVAKISDQVMPTKEMTRSEREVQQMQQEDEVVIEKAKERGIGLCSLSRYYQMKYSNIILQKNIHTFFQNKKLLCQISKKCCIMV